MACSSFVKVSQYIFKWNFECNNFSKNKETIKSGIYYAGADQETAWRIIFYLNDPCNGGETGYASLRLTLLHGKDVDVSGEMSLLGDETVIVKKTIIRKFYRKDDSELFRNLTKQSAINYKMTVVCKISINEENSLPYVRRVRDFNQVVSDIHSLLVEQKDTDVSLVSQDQKEFRAHKTVLAARSEVFAAMFRNEFQENLEGRIDISDMMGYDVEEMLQYIYSGNLSNWSQALCLSLFETGDKYKINGLKEACSWYMQENMTVDASVKSLISADMHGDEDFKKIVLKYIKRNVKNVLKSPDWKTMIQEQPHLVDEVILAISDYSY